MVAIRTRLTSRDITVFTRSSLYTLVILVEMGVLKRQINKIIAFMVNQESGIRESLFLSRGNSQREMRT